MKQYQHHRTHTNEINHCFFSLSFLVLYNWTKHKCHGRIQTQYMLLMAWSGWTMELDLYNMLTKSPMAWKQTSSLSHSPTKALFNVCPSNFINCCSSVYFTGVNYITQYRLSRTETPCTNSAEPIERPPSKYALPLTNLVRAIASLELPNQVQQIPAIISFEDSFAFVLCSRCILLPPHPLCFYVLT